jgi:hypothetical protein
MSRQRRSTGQIINKALTVVAVLIVIHVVTRLIYTFTVGSGYGYNANGKWVKLYEFRTFLEFSPSVFDNWGGYIFFHALGIAATFLLWCICYIAKLVVQWVFFEKETATTKT